MLDWMLRRLNLGGYPITPIGELRAGTRVAVRARAFGTEFSAPFTSRRAILAQVEKTRLEWDFFGAWNRKSVFVGRAAFGQLFVLKGKTGAVRVDPTRGLHLTGAKQVVRSDHLYQRSRGSFEEHFALSRADTFFPAAPNEKVCESIIPPGWVTYVRGKVHVLEGAPPIVSDGYRSGGPQLVIRADSQLRVIAERP